MSITNWPKNERPRERLILKGPEALTDAELLSILWGHGTRGKNVTDIARDLITHFGNLRVLCYASLNQLCQHHGMGVSKYCQLQASLELSRRCTRTPLDRSLTLTTAEAVANYLQTHLRDDTQEIFAALFLDSKNRVIQFEKLFFGSIDNATVYPRMLVKRALHHNAAAIIVAHNHPSGITKPSQADIELTCTLVKALALIDVKLLDHMIVGDNSVESIQV